MCAKTRHLICLAILLLSGPSWTATTVTVGTDPTKFVIKGKIVTPDQVIDGELVIEGDIITCVSASCPDPPGATRRTVSGGYMLKTPQTQAVIAFGTGAHQVVDLWPGAAGLFVARTLHPSFRDDAALRANWNTWLPQIRPHLMSEVPPDMTPYAGSWQHVQKGRPREHPAPRPTVWCAEMGGDRRHGLANLDNADRVEVARGGRVGPTQILTDA
jgi:hypothetical protein